MTRNGNIRSVLTTWLLLGVLVLPVLASEKPLPALRFGTAPWPPHPTRLLAKYRGDFAPVVAAEKDAPVILVDGKRRTLPKSTELVTRLAPDYVPVHLDFTGGLPPEGKHETVQGTPSADPIDSASSHGSLTLKPDRDLPDCFLLVTTFDIMNLQHPDAEDHCRTTLFEIGTLRAGERRTVPFSARRIFDDAEYEGNGADHVYTAPETIVFWQLYSQGQEVKMTDLANELITAKVTVMESDVTSVPQSVHGLGLFFYQHERGAHADAVEAWARANRHGNHAAEPYGQTPLMTGTDEGLPHEASAILAVGADGKVKDVALEGSLPPAAAEKLGFCLRLWLFLPAIKNGTPVPTRIRIPLEF